MSNIVVVQSVKQKANGIETKVGKLKSDVTTTIRQKPALGTNVAKTQTRVSTTGTKVD